MILTTAPTCTVSLAKLGHILTRWGCGPLFCQQMFHFSVQDVEKIIECWVKKGDFFMQLHYTSARDFVSGGASTHQKILIL